LIVDYSTNGASFAGLKVSQFFERLSHDGIPWPLSWRIRPSSAYPDVGQRIREIPNEDRKYVDFVYEVISRQPKADPLYDTEQTDALRQIRDTLQ
jgi:hypothetical protein